MKKLIIMLFALLFALGMTACKENNQNIEASNIETAAAAVDKTSDDTIATIDSVEGVTDAFTSTETQPVTKEPGITETEPVVTEPVETEQVETKPVTQPTPPSTPAATTPTNSVDSTHQHDYFYKRVRDDSLCPEDGYVYHYCSCGKYQIWQRKPQDHAYSFNEIIKATHDREGLLETKCQFCPYEKTEVVPKVNVPYFIGIELVSCERPNSVYLSDGTQLLDKVYGQYQVAQIGDTYTYRIVMSDGGTTGFTVENARPWDADMTVEGNLVTMTVTNMTGNAEFYFRVRTNDIDNNKICRGKGMMIEYGNYKLTDTNDSLYITLRTYIEKNGMYSNLFLLNDFNAGVLTSYTNGDPSKSITGTGRYSFDDYIVMEEHENPLEMYFELIDEYKARGFTKVYLYYYMGVIELKAC